MAIVNCQVIVDEIGKHFASGKPIVVGGRELIGYTRLDGTVFKRWVPKDEAPDRDADYVEFDLPDGEPAEPETVYTSDAPDDAVIQAQAELLREERHAQRTQRPSVRDLPPSDDGPE